MYVSDTRHSNASLQQKLQYLFSLRQGTKVNWDRVEYLRFLERLGDDHKCLPPVIHVAGTNGKGSIVAMLRAIFEAQGYTVHAYTSPHLMRANERLYVAGADIADERLEALIDEVMPFIQGVELTFFEIMTAMAFREFSRVPADIVLLEVGCGGRLDCTNVIEKPLSTVISRISMDHTDYLGDTLAKIAAEKAGIMKPDVPCVIGYQGEGTGRHEILEVLNNAAHDIAAKTFFFDKDWRIDQQKDQMIFTYGETQETYPVPNLLGAHQILNAGAVLAVLETLSPVFSFSHAAISRGLQNIIWAGRLQKLSPSEFDLPENYEIWLDCGHNDSAGDILAQQLKDWAGQSLMPTHMIVGMLGTKDIKRFLEPLLPMAQTISIVPIAGEQSAKTYTDVQKIFQSNQKIEESRTVAEAINTIARNQIPARILIAGSVYLAGSVLKGLKNP